MGSMTVDSRVDELYTRYADALAAFSADQD